MDITTPAPLLPQGATAPAAPAGAAGTQSPAAKTTPATAATPGSSGPAQPGDPGQAGDVAQNTPATGADFNSFLKLLTAQLRNQDPLQPLDSTQFVAQLASFSTVEQIIGTNQRLDKLAEQAAGSELTRISGWIGRSVAAVDGHFTASGGPETFGVPALPGSEWTEAIVKRSDGVELDRFAVTPDASGQAVWPGGASVPAGTELRIELAYHGAGVVQDRRPAPVFREITGVHGTADGAVLDLAGGGTLGPSEVSELRR